MTARTMASVISIPLSLLQKPRIEQHHQHRRDNRKHDFTYPCYHPRGAVPTIHVHADGGMEMRTQ